MFRSIGSTRGRAASGAAALSLQVFLRTSLLLLLCLLAASGIVRGDDAIEREKLQGRWTWVKPSDSDNKKKTAASGILFKGASVTFLGGGGKGIAKGTYTIDPTRTPKTMDIIIEKDGKKTTTQAIYDLKDDTLRICHYLGKRAATERPMEFVADKQTVLGVLKRDKE